jgi:hypothetical protein
MDVEETTELQNNPPELFEGDIEGDNGEGEDVTFINKTVTISDNGTIVIN